MDRKKTATETDAGPVTRVTRYTLNDCRNIKAGGSVNSSWNIKAGGSLIKAVGRMIKANRRLIRGYKYFHHSVCTFTIRS